MINKTIRLRQRNQLTLPAAITEELGLEEGDFLQVTLSDEGHLRLRPAWLVTAGSPEARLEDRRAEEDIRAGRYHSFDNAEEFSDDLLYRRKRTQPNPVRKKKAAPKKARSEARASR